jgi:hypothetical protein
VGADLKVVQETLGHSSIVLTCDTYTSVLPEIAHRSGVLDWSEASQGDALFDLATLTLGHEEHLGDVVAGYGTDVDRDLIRAWWSLRCLTNVRWLAEHGYGSPEEFPEVALLRSRP